MSTTPGTPLPNWAEMSDLDKGAALLFLHKIDWEGIEYAMSDYPARYFDHPALVALSPRGACAHAVSVEDDATSVSDGENERLYDLALEADRARSHAEHQVNVAGGAA
jgi:hypothetical protein